MIQSSPQLVPISGANTREVSGNDNNKPIELKLRETDQVNFGKSGVGTIADVKSEGEVVDELVNSLMNLDHCAEDEIKDGLVSSREGVKRSATGDIAPPPRHYRSLSMDSAIGKFCLGDESPKLQCNRADQLSPADSFGEKSTKLNLEFGHGEFNDVELKKIMADERLAEIAISDPRRAKRILANRQSAARSKERKLRYISELEHKVQTLQSEATTLSAQVTILQKEYAELTNRNNELKFRVQAMEQQAQIRDALHEALTSEVQHLKLREERRTSNGMAQQVPMNHHVFPMQHQQPNQMQRISVSTSTTSSTASAAPTSA
ncbi:hypothetical protein DH2020_007523 [Rehmannia glutinosa]|uniref:BZIP domain-containing protein n=1 Tax=Rehmannia glutinosa TaxID=99300 RepID=A0ABR0TYE0_REHGL